MPVYTVHGGQMAQSRLDASDDRITLVRDGFHFWAFAMTLVWLVWHRLWWALLGYIAFSVAVAFLLSSLGVSGGSRMAVMVVISLLVGFEASSLWRWTLSRGKWRQLDVVVADDVEAAERRFFDRWANRRREHSYSTDRGAPPPTRHVAAQPFSRGPEDVIGLFPQPGVTR
jgi:hypothetical protein